MSVEINRSITRRKRNGELIQVGPEGSTGSGSVAGVVLI